MIAGVRMRDLLIALSVSGAALGGATAGIAGRGADDAFLARQKNPTIVETAAVEQLIRTAPDPIPPHESDATASRCRADGRRELRTPWQCTVRYRSGSVARYRVTIETDGSYRARYSLVIRPDGVRDPGRGATASGCCLRAPTRG